MLGSNSTGKSVFWSRCPKKSHESLDFDLVFQELDIYFGVLILFRSCIFVHTRSGTHGLEGYQFGTQGNKITAVHV